MFRKWLYLLLITLGLCSLGLKAYADDAYLLNMSTQGEIGNGKGLVAGFIIPEGQPLTVLLQGGWATNDFVDPQLILLSLNSSGQQIILDSNNDCQINAYVPQGSKDACMEKKLDTGSYLLRLDSSTVETALATVAVTKLDTGENTPRLINLSTQGSIQGSQTKIVAGFVIDAKPNTALPVVLRGGWSQNPSLDPIILLENIDTNSVIKHITDFNCDTLQYAPASLLDACFKTYLPSGSYLLSLYSVTNEVGLATVAVDVDLSSLPEQETPSQESSEPETPTIVPPQFFSKPTSDSILSFSETVETNGVLSESLLTIGNTAEESAEDLIVDLIGLRNESDFSVKTNFPLNIAANDYQSVKLQCNPTSKGSKETLLELSTNAPNNPYVSYPVKCEAKSATECPINTVDTAGNLIQGSLGVGFDQDRERYKPERCITGTEKLIGGGSESLAFDTIMSYEEVKSEFKNSSMNFDISIGSDFFVSLADIEDRKEGEEDSWLSKLLSNKIADKLPSDVAKLFAKKSVTDFLAKLGKKVITNLTLDFSASYGKTKYYNSIKETKLTKAMTFKAEKILPTVQYSNVSWTNNAKTIINSDDSCRFKLACGDSYVSQVKKGARLYVSAVFKFHRLEEKERFSSKSYSFSLLSFGKKVKEQAQESKIDNMQVSIYAYQEGGSQASLTELLAPYNADITDEVGDMPPIVTCSLDNLNACDEFISQVLTYARTDFANAVKENSGNLAVFDLKPTPYSVLPLAPIPLNYKEIDADIEQARFVTRREYQTNEDALVTLFDIYENYAPMLSEAQKLVYEENIAKVTANVIILSNAIEVCYSNIPSCVATKNRAISELVDYDTSLLAYPPKITTSLLDEVQIGDTGISVKCDLPPDYVLTGFGAGSYDNVNPLMCEGRKFNANGTLGTKEKFGDETELAVTTPEGNYVVVGVVADALSFKVGANKTGWTCHNHKHFERISRIAIQYREFDAVSRKLVGDIHEVSVPNGRPHEGRCDRTQFRTSTGSYNPSQHDFDIDTTVPTSIGFGSYESNFHQFIGSTYVKLSTLK